MKAILLAFFLLASVSAQCTLQDVPYNGVFSSSGVYKVFRTLCNGIPTQTGFPINYLSVGVDSVTADNTETVTSYQALQLAAQLNVFILVDGSGSQVASLPNTVTQLKTLVNSGFSNNNYQNVSVAAAYFDGENGYKLLSDWTDANSALQTIYNKFSSNYLPTDNSTNFYGAYQAAESYLDAKMAKYYWGNTIASGLMIVTGNGYDTASSYYQINSANYPAPKYSHATLAMAPALYSALLGQIADTVVVLDNPNYNTQAANYFRNYFNDNYATSAQGYWLAKHCAAARPISYKNTNTFVDPNVHRLSINYRGTTGAIISSVGSSFNVANFTKGCNINASINSVSALTFSAGVVLCAFLALLF